MTGAVVQISISPGGVPKTPIPLGRVHKLGVEGDQHAHPEIHGGPRQALLFIAEEVLDELKAEGYPVFAGALGENITTRGLDPGKFRIGQRWRVGPEVVVQMTKVRVPCSAIKVYGESIGNRIYDKNVKQGDTTSPLYATGGMYAAVLEPGVIRPGDAMILMEEFA
jgi:MOSC domain-containing protein YiiM